MWKRLVEKGISLSIKELSLFFGGYLVGVLIIALASEYFSLKKEVSLVELLTLAFSILAAIAVPLLLKRLTSDADARRDLFLADVNALLVLYESSSSAMREHRVKKSTDMQIQDYVRKFSSSSERALDLVQEEITHLRRFQLSLELKRTIKAYDNFLGDAPFLKGFTITDDFLKRQDELLHSIRLEMRKYQYGVFMQ